VRKIIVVKKKIGKMREVSNNILNTLILLLPTTTTTKYLVAVS
jgi:hypothetical protein